MSESNLINNYKQTDAALQKEVSKARKNFQQDKDMGMVQGEDFQQWANSRAPGVTMAYQARQNAVAALSSYWASKEGFNANERIRLLSIDPFKVEPGRQSLRYFDEDKMISLRELEKNQLNKALGF